MDERMDNESKWVYVPQQIMYDILSMTYVVRLMNLSQEQLHQLAWLLQSKGHSWMDGWMDGWMKE